MKEYSQVRNIIVTDEIGKRSAKYSNDLILPNSTIIETLDSLDKLPFIFKDIPLENTVYFLHPFLNNTFLPISIDSNSMGLDRLEDLSLLALRLGAKSFRSKHIHKEVEIKEFDTGTEVNFPVGQLNVDFRKNNGLKEESIFELSETYSVSNEVDFEEAIKLATDSGLYKEKAIRNLIEKRNPKFKSKLQDYDFRIHLSREFSKSYSLAIEAAAYLQRISVKGGFNYSSIKIEEVELDISIRF